MYSEATRTDCPIQDILQTLRKHLAQHNECQVYSTKSRIPLELISFEGCSNQQDDTRGEKYLKFGSRKIYLKTG